LTVIAQSAASPVKQIVLLAGPITLATLQIPDLDIRNRIAGFEQTIILKFYEQKTKDRKHLIKF
jgi:hypothetical protein